MFKSQVIDLKNIDRETRLLYAGMITFHAENVFEPLDLKLSTNEALGRLFTNTLLRRITRDIQQLPAKSTDITITVFPDGLHYAWVKDDEKYELVSHDSNALPSTISIGFDNRLITLPEGLLETNSLVRGVTLSSRAFKSREEWRSNRGDRNLLPYMVIAEIAEYINSVVVTDIPLINFQSVENMHLIDIQPHQFTMGIDILGRLYTLTVDTK